MIAGLMSPSDALSLAVVALIAVVPLAVVLLFAIMRSYTIDVHMTRDHHRRHRRGDDDDEP